MKGMSFKLVADVLIALVGVWVILTAFNMFLPNYTGPALCKLYQVILIVPLPQSLKPTISQCEITPTKENIILRPQSSSELKNKIVDYIWSCWSEKGNNGKAGITFSCYEILVKNVPSVIQEKDIKDVLKSKGYCFDNKDSDCGIQNRTYWSGGNISGTDASVFINFNSFFHWVEVAV